MNIDDLMKRKEQLEEHIFMIDMIDRWQPEDEKAWHRLNKELKEVEKQIKKLERRK